MIGLEILVAYEDKTKYIHVINQRLLETAQGRRNFTVNSSCRTKLGP
jgi:hypothetical protein